MTSHSATLNQNDEVQVPTLDLHGYPLDNALRLVTDFLEYHRKAKKKNINQNASSSATVMIITGTGNHSSALGGPTLIHAVEDLLQRRQMIYCRGGSGGGSNRMGKLGPGSFLVQADSGITFNYNPRLDPALRSSTKVILRNQQELPHPNRVANDAVNTRRYAPAYFRTPSTPFDTASSVDTEYISTVSKCKAMSFELMRQEEELKKKETMELQDAFQLSLLNYNIDSIQAEQENKLMEHAILSSTTDVTRPSDDLDEEEQFKLALELSNLAEQEISQREEDLLQQALHASIGALNTCDSFEDESFVKSPSQNRRSASDNMEQEEEKMQGELKIAAADVTEHQSEDEQLKMALELSYRTEQEISQREEDLLQQALNASTSEFNTYYDDDEDVINLQLNGQKQDCAEVKETAKILQDAIKVPGEDATRPLESYDEEEQFKIALELSRRNEEEINQLERDLLQQALNASTTECDGWGDEDQLLDRVVQMSIQTIGGIQHDSRDTNEKQKYRGILKNNSHDANNAENQFESSMPCAGNVDDDRKDDDADEEQILLQVLAKSLIEN